MFLIYMAFPNFAKQKIPRILQRITSLTLGSSALLTTPQPLEAKGYMKERRHHRLQPTVFQSLSLLRLLLRNYTLESIHSHLQNLLLFLSPFFACPHKELSQSRKNSFFSSSYPTSFVRKSFRLRGVWHFGQTT